MTNHRAAIAGLTLALLGSPVVLLRAAAPAPAVPAVPAAQGAPPAAATLRQPNAEAARLAPLFKSATFKGGQGTTLPYRYFEPAAKAADDRYPVVLYLHGEGEAGTDNAAQITTTDGATVWVEPRHLALNPSYVLAPQLARGKDWTSDAVYADTRALLDQFIKAHPQADTNRIYIVGFSMGATGLYNMILKNPQLFAAAMPISGSADKYLGDHAAWAALKHLPVIVIHSYDDTIVPVSAAQNAINALKAGGNTYVNAGGATPCLWSPGSTPVPHDAWWTAFRKFEVVYNSLYFGDLGRTEHGALDPVTTYVHRDLGNGVVQVWDYALGTTLVIERADKAVLIDTTMGRIGRDGGIYQYIRDHVLKNRNADIEVFITHQHNDHIIGLASFVGAPQVKKIYVHREDAPLVLKMMGPDASKVTFVKDGDRVPLGGKDIEVIGVRGHTFGAIVMKYENFLFSGDSIGTGYVGISVISLEEYVDSLKHLLERMGDGRYIVYGGHTGEVTTPLTDQYVRDMLDCVQRVVNHAIPGPVYWRSNDLATRKVSAVRGSAITYDINNVRRIKGALRGLAISRGVLSQGYVPPAPAYVETARGPAVPGPNGFLAYITQYYSVVDSATSTLDITPTVRDLEFRGVTVNGAAVQSDEPYHATLMTGENRFPIVVTAADGTARTYTLTIVRRSP